MNGIQENRTSGDVRNANQFIGIERKNKKLIVVKKEKERWKDIPGYEGYYAASTFGRIKSIERVVYHSLKGKKTIHEKILNMTPRFGGYSSVSLYKNGTAKHYRVHNLIMLTFVGPCPRKQQVMHLKSVSFGLDNSLSNLRYGSPACNHAFKYDDGTHNMGSNHPLSKLTESTVLKIKTLLNHGGYKHKEIAKMFSVSRQTISCINQGRTWRHV